MKHTWVKFHNDAEGLMYILSGKVPGLNASIMRASGE